MTHKRTFVFVVALTGVLFLTAGVGTVAAQSAPDCSTVSYNGDGTTSNPYEVGDIDELQCIEEQDLDANYVQVSDIDASGTSSWNGGNGFGPIGDPEALGTPFTGTYDGQRNSITDLTIDRGTEPAVGLFSRVDTSGEITNVSLVNADVLGSTPTGALVGGNDGTISESYATGAVGGPGSETTAASAGGLVGANGADGSITESYSSVSVDSAAVVGGLAGGNDGTVEKSYARGSVEGFTTVGGFIGANSGTVTESYATGSVSLKDIDDDPIPDPDPLGEDGDTGESDTESLIDPPDGLQLEGGLIAVNNDGTVSDSYWDTETTGQSSSDGGTGLATSQMSGSAATTNMVGFDFTETWETVTGPDDYPVLAWQTEDVDDGDPPDTGDGLVSIDAPGTAQPDGDFDFTVEMTESSVGEVAVESSDFGVSLSVVDDDGDSIGSQTDTSVEFLDISATDSTYTLGVDITGGSEGDTGTITAATGGNIDDPGADEQVSETFSLADALSSPVDGVSDELWTAVTQDDGSGGLSLADLGNAIQQYQKNPTDADVGGVSISLGDLGSLIQHYRNVVV